MGIHLQYSTFGAFRKVITHIRYIVGREGGRWDEGNVTFFGEESNKEPVCDVKVNWMKKGSGPGHPRGRENSRVRIGASAIRPLEYFPYGLAAPARAD